MNPEAGAFYFDKSDCTLWYCSTGSTNFGRISLYKVNSMDSDDGTCFCSLETFAKDFRKVAFLIEEEAK